MAVVDDMSNVTYSWASATGELRNRLWMSVNDHWRSTRLRKQKQKRLQAKGWKVGTVKEFLGLSNEEAAYIELKIKLAAGLRQRRQQKGLSQLDLAAKLESSQSRVAKMEAGDPSVSLDLLIRSLIAFGTTKRELSQIITTPRAA